MCFSKIFVQFIMYGNFFSQKAYNDIMKQIMTDASTNRKSIWLLGFSRAWKQLTITLGFASGNSQLFPGPPESLEPDRFSCCPRDQSLFV